MKKNSRRFIGIPANLAYGEKVCILGRAEMEHCYVLVTRGGEGRE